MTTASASRTTVGSIAQIRPRTRGHWNARPAEAAEFPGSSALGTGAPLQEAGVERQRQKVLQVVRALAIGEVRELDLEVAAELPQDLPARAAGRRRFVGVGHDRDPRERAVA